jgi:hypothetical protein
VLNRLRLAQAKRRYMEVAPRSGPTAVIALVVVAILVGIGVYLEVRSADRDGALRRHVMALGVNPLMLVADAGRAHRMLFLADVAGSALPKEFAGDVIERLARGPGVDAVVVAIDPGEQVWIDRYFGSEPEDASVLVAHPRSLGGGQEADRSMLGLYRRIWQLNRELGAARRIQVVAGDAEGWPPLHPLSPAQALIRFGERDQRMLDAIENQVLARDARARVIVFADGLHVLRGRGRLETGGASPVQLLPAAALAAARFPGEVYSVVVDVPPARGFIPDVAAYSGTRAWELVNRMARSKERIGMPLGEAFGSADPMLRIVTKPGISFMFTPAGALLSSYADAYVFLASMEAR